MNARDRLLSVGAIGGLAMVVLLLFGVVYALVARPHYLVSSPAAKAVETVDVIQKAVSTYAGTHRGIIPEDTPDLHRALVEKELISSDLNRPEYEVVGIFRDGPEQYSIVLRCDNDERCQDISAAKKTDDAVIGISGINPVKLKFRL